MENDFFPMQAVKVTSLLYGVFLSCSLGHGGGVRIVWFLFEPANSLSAITVEVELMFLVLKANMAQSNWEADKMLDVYIHDYLLKRNLHGSAKTFMTEGKVATEPVAIDAPGGFLFEWWSVFWDIFIARTNEKHSDVAAAYIEAQQMKAKEQQNQQAQMQQLQILQQRRAQMHRDTNHTSLNVPSNGMNPDNILGQSPASVMALKMYEEQLKQHPHTRDLDSSGQLLDANRLALLKSTGHHSRQLVQVTPGNAPMALQQVNARSQLPSDNKSDVNLSRSISIDPALYGLPGAMQSRPAIGDAGLNQGVSSLPLKGWPLTGIDRFRPSSGQQFSKVVLQSPNQLQQFQMFTPQQQQQLLAHAEAQAQAQGNLVSSLSANCADMDPRRLRVLRSGLNGKDVQPTGTDGSQHADSPIQTASSLVRAASKDQIELLMKMMAQMQQPVKYQQQHDQLQQQQSVQNGRKRKQMSHSGTANSSGTGNTPGPSPNSAPSTPSTHTPGDGMSMAGALPHNNSMSKNLMIYGSDGGTGGLASTSEHLDDLENFGDVGSLDDNVESFLSQDDGDTRDAAHVPKGFSFAELGRLRSSSGKVVCCHFSSDGKVLASAGHDKKVYLWNMDTLDFKSTVEEHSLLITDVRFRSNSAYFATSSFDKTLQVWNAADPSYSLFKLSGHTTQVTSLDFHPKKLDVLCSCDANNEIRLWNINQHASTRISKGGTRQVRFQHRVGQFLAAAAENVINIIDVETDQHQLSLQGHSKEVRSVCWDSSGDHLASVSEDCVRVWSVASGGECIHELSSNGNNFSSCTFHPSYSHLLIIGGYQSLELWHLTENKSMTIAAHEGLVAALENSPTAGMVASASHDKCVKVWK